MFVTSCMSYNLKMFCFNYVFFSYLLYWLLLLNSPFIIHLTLPLGSVTAPLTLRCESLLKYEYGTYLRWHLMPSAFFFPMISMSPKKKYFVRLQMDYESRTYRAGRPTACRRWCCAPSSSPCGTRTCCQCSKTPRAPFPREQPRKTFKKCVVQNAKMNALSIKNTSISNNFFKKINSNTKRKYYRTITKRQNFVFGYFSKQSFWFAGMFVLFCERKNSLSK